MHTWNCHTPLIVGNWVCDNYTLNSSRDSETGSWANFMGQKGCPGNNFCTVILTDLEFTSHRSNSSAWAYTPLSKHWAPIALLLLFTVLLTSANEQRLNFHSYFMLAAFALLFSPPPSLQLCKSWTLKRSKLYWHAQIFRVVLYSQTYPPRFVVQLSMYILPADQ